VKYLFYRKQVKGQYSRIVCVYVTSVLR